LSIKVKMKLLCKLNNKTAGLPGRKLLDKSNEKGSAAIAVLFIGLLVFAILPVFAAVVEKYILLNKVQIIQDAVDVSNTAIYNTLNREQLGKSFVHLDTQDTLKMYRKILAKNLALDENLLPLKNSVADGEVIIESLQIFQGGTDYCPDGTRLIRTSVHSRLSIPVKPALYINSVLSGREYYELKIHVDTEIPLNN